MSDLPTMKLCRHCGQSYGNHSDRIGDARDCVFAPIESYVPPTLSAETVRRGREIVQRLVERVKVEVEIPVDVAFLAEQFAALTDDAQAQFLCFAAERLGTAAENQAGYIGNHLRTCECSTESGRKFVRDIVDAMSER